MKNTGRLDLVDGAGAFDADRQHEDDDNRDQQHQPQRKAEGGHADIAIAEQIETQLYRRGPHQKHGTPTGLNPQADRGKEPGQREDGEIDKARHAQGGNGTHLAQTNSEHAGGIVEAQQQADDGNDADIDADGSDEIFAGAESGYVYCLNSDGSLRWSFNTQAAVSDLATVDFLGDGQRWVVAGGPGGKVFGIDHDGKERWTCQIPFYKRAGHVRVIFPADLAGEGRQVAIVGAENWHYYALDASGSHIWQYESVHPSTAGTAADLDGDGKEELALGTAYYWWHLINPD